MFGKGPSSAPGRPPQRSVDPSIIREGGNPRYPRAGQTTLFVPGENPGDPAVPMERFNMQTSPPPQNPQQTQEQVETSADVGRLLNELGQMRELLEMERQKSALQMNALLAGLQTARQPGAAPPQNGNGQEFDPNAPVTMGSLQGILASVAPGFQSQAIRGAWDVTPDEEQKALEYNPILQTLPEPVKTQQIRQTVLILRQQASKTASPTRPGTEASPQNPQQQSAPTAARPTVPQTERPSSAVQTAEPTGPSFQDDAAQAIMEYERLREQELPQARTKKEKNEVLARMKAQMRAAQIAQGLTDEDFSRMSFQQGEGPQ